ncbi:mycofactocin precursor MftA [Actinomadura keratinilytica]|jgi:mycofactocin precursor
MQRDIRHAEQARQNDADGAAAIDPDDLAEELLVEEVSIDGMCGVY